VKDLYPENYKMLLKGIKEDTNIRWVSLIWNLELFQIPEFFRFWNICMDFMVEYPKPKIYILQNLKLFFWCNWGSVTMKFQFCKIKSFRNWMHWSIYLKMIKMANFVLGIFYNN
jgi:hypothetical protein